MDDLEKFLFSKKLAKRLYVHLFKHKWTEEFKVVFTMETLEGEEFFVLVSEKDQNFWQDLKTIVDKITSKENQTFQGYL